MKPAGRIAMRRRLFMGRGEMMCPDLAYFGLGNNNSCNQIGSANVVRACPECVIEVCPHSREVRRYKNRMLRWIASGIPVGVLVIPQEHCANVYSLGSEPVVVYEDLHGNGKLEGLVIKFSELWSLDVCERA